MLASSRVISGIMYETAIIIREISPFRKNQIGSSCPILYLYNQQPSNLRVLLWATTLRNTACLPLDTPNFTSGMDAPLSNISYHHAEEASPWTSLFLLWNDRSWIWTVCRSAVLPVGELQRRWRTHLLSSFWELVGSGRTSLYSKTPQKMCFS